MSALRKQIEAAINRNSAENGSDTPDFILAEYLTDCLAVLDRTVRVREKWYGREPQAIALADCPPPPILEISSDTSPPDERAVSSFTTQVNKMHYRNGRVAKDGDKIIQLEGGNVTAVGVLHSTRPDGGDFCNGQIAPIQATPSPACLCDCLHLDDVKELLESRGLHERPKDPFQVEPQHTPFPGAQAE